MATEGPTPREETESTEAKIAEQVLAVHHESYGTGATDVQVHFAGDNVFVVLDIELTAAERTLARGGSSEAVKRTREAFQDVIAPTFTAIIERTTGRRVASFLSAVSVDPLYSVEIFRLEPRA
jgi:uncharacterized protein YbcI